MEWLHTDNGYQSRVYGDFAFADVAGVLSRWNYEKIIESKKGSGSIDLTWPGRPDQWALENSEGPIYLKVSDGRFLKASKNTAGSATHPIPSI